MFRSGAWRTFSGRRSVCSQNWLLWRIFDSPLLRSHTRATGTVVDGTLQEDHDFFFQPRLEYLFDSLALALQRQLLAMHRFSTPRAKCPTQKVRLRARCISSSLIDSAHVCTFWPELGVLSSTRLFVSLLFSFSLTHANVSYLAFVRSTAFK